MRDLFGTNLPVMALPEETCRTIATRFAVHHLERLPVEKTVGRANCWVSSPEAIFIKPSLALIR